MRRSASEIINNLEVRVARLERQASELKYDTHYLPSKIKHILKSNRIRSKLMMDGSRQFADKKTLIEALVALGVPSTEARMVANEGTTWPNYLEIHGMEFEVLVPEYILKPKDFIAVRPKFAQESFKRGDMVMILTVKPGQNGSYSNPGRVEAVMGDEVRVSVGMAQVIKPVGDLVKATGRKSENIKIWQANH